MTESVFSLATILQRGCWTCGRYLCIDPKKKPGIDPKKEPGIDPKKERGFSEVIEKLSI